MYNENNHSNRVIFLCL